MHIPYGSTLTVDLGGAADPNVRFVAFYSDYDINGRLVKKGVNAEVGAGTTDVDLVDSPAVDHVRVVENIQIYNGDNASATVSIWYDNGTTEYPMAVVALATLEHMQWTKERGFMVLTATGELKVTTA